MRRPDLAIHVRSTAPHWLFHHSVFVSPQAIDIGIVQSDSLGMNIPQTLRAWQRLHDRLPAIILKESAYIRRHDVRLIVGDIPPLCFEIAARLAIPSVALTNFTWGWIYRFYTNEYPAFSPLVDEMEAFYRKASLALTLPYSCNLEVFARREPIPWIARHSTLTKGAARKAFDLPEDATVVLLSFGGLGLKRLPWGELKKLRDFVFVTTDARQDHDGNLRILPEMQRHYEDLVRAADIVVTKPGYGIVADVIAHRVRALYAERTDFPEYFRLAEALRDCATVVSIPQHELLLGNLAPYLRRLQEQKQNWPTVSFDGARVAAEKILALL